MGEVEVLPSWASEQGQSVFNGGTFKHEAGSKRKAVSNEIRYINGLLMQERRNEQLYLFFQPSRLAVKLAAVSPCFWSMIG